jgi:hypothetical protein
MNTTQQTVSGSASGKRGLIITLVIFLVPFAAAAFLHLTGLYKEMGTSNRGVLIAPPVAVSEIGLTELGTQAPVSLTGKWHILYALPQVCSSSCKNTLKVIHQIRTALGPEADRVGLVAALQSGGLPEGITLATDIQQVAGVNIPDLMASKVDARAEKGSSATPTPDVAPAGPASTDRIYLIDTMGMIFMYHITYADERTAVLKGKDLLRDLQHALKLSKIG